MTVNPLAYLLGYPASFCTGAEDVRRNVFRMIRAEIPGWHGGPRVWAERLRLELRQPYRTRKLNGYGARLDASEWVWVIRGLIEDCEAAAITEEPDPCAGAGSAQDFSPPAAVPAAPPP